MKLSNFASSALLVLTACGTATPVHAETLLPNLFAHEYCSLRSIGATQDAALGAAIRKATISSNDWVYVTLGGRRLRSDHVQATQAARQRCPQFNW